MSDRRLEIRQAIDAFQMERARELVEVAIAEDPSAETYYLASQAAVQQGQRVEYLQKALESDPEFQPALEEMAAINSARKPIPRPEPAPPAELQPLQPKPAPTVMALASVGKRLLAILIDGIVIAIPTLMLVGVTGISGNLESALIAGDETLIADAFSRLQSEIQVLVFLISAVYNVLFMVYFNGQTLGKIMLGLRVVKKNGRRISWLDAILRNVLGYTVSGIFLLGYIWALFDREKQAWHDKMAGTVVVDERAQSSDRRKSR